MQSCFIRRQQACGVGPVIAMAAGAMMLTNSRTNNNLAVRRCMRIKAYGMEGECASGVGVNNV